jgi:hypothetical protein
MIQAHLVRSWCNRPRFGCGSPGAGRNLARCRAIARTSEQCANFGGSAPNSPRWVQWSEIRMRQPGRGRKSAPCRATAANSGHRSKLGPPHQIRSIRAELSDFGAIVRNPDAGPGPRRNPHALPHPLHQLRINAPTSDHPRPTLRFRCNRPESGCRSPDMQDALTAQVARSSLEMSSAVARSRASSGPRSEARS